MMSLVLSPERIGIQDAGYERKRRIPRSSIRYGVEIDKPLPLKFDIRMNRLGARVRAIGLKANVLKET